MQPSLNEVPVTTPQAASTLPPSNEGVERKRPAGADDENINPEEKPPKPKQPRTIEIELAPSANDNQDTSGMCVHVYLAVWHSLGIIATKFDSVIGWWA